MNQGYKDRVSEKLADADAKLHRAALLVRSAEIMGAMRRGHGDLLGAAAGLVEEARITVSVAVGMLAEPDRT